MRKFLTLALTVGLLLGVMTVAAHSYENKNWSRWAKQNCKMGPYGNTSHVRDLIRCAHNRVGHKHQTRTSLYIANRESGYNPRAKNPYSTAGGLYQWLESSWPGTRFPSMARRFGYPSWNRFDARAAAFVSARVMKQSGCSPWFTSC